MSVIQLDQHAYPPPNPAQSVAEFLQFLISTRERLKEHLASKHCDEVQLITSKIEEHYVDDQGKPAMYQQFESALYDDARSMVTLWPFFERFDLDQLATFGRMLRLEIEGLTGDRHPRKVFDRSPFGIAALVAGTTTLWMTA